jgi:hypothetical protein
VIATGSASLHAAQPKSCRRCPRVASYSDQHRDVVVVDVLVGRFGFGKGLCQPAYDAPWHALAGYSRATPRADTATVHFVGSPDTLCLTGCPACCCSRQPPLA